MAHGQHTRDNDNDSNSDSYDYGYDVDGDDDDSRQKESWDTDRNLVTFTRPLVSHSLIIRDKGKNARNTKC